MSIIARPSPLSVTIARAVIAGKAKYDALPNGEAIGTTVANAIARAHKVATSTYRTKGKGSVSLGDAKSILKANVGRMPSDLPKEVFKSGDFAADAVTLIAVKEWAAVTASLAIVESFT